MCKTYFIALTEILISKIDDQYHFWYELIRYPELFDQLKSTYILNDDSIYNKIHYLMFKHQHNYIEQSKILDFYQVIEFNKKDLNMENLFLDAKLNDRIYMYRPTN